LPKEATKATSTTARNFRQKQAGMTMVGDNTCRKSEDGTV